MDHRGFRLLEPLDQVHVARFIHQEADRTSVHAEDRRAGLHETVQRLQHHAVAAERDDDVGFSFGRVAIQRHQAIMVGIRFRRAG